MCDTICRLDVIFKTNFTLQTAYPDTRILRSIKYEIAFNFISFVYITSNHFSYESYM